MLLDIWLSKPNLSHTDYAGRFLPESLALGAAVAAGGSQALLLGALIALQNIPEGFNAYRELRQFDLFRLGYSGKLFGYGMFWSACRACGLFLAGRITGSGRYDYIVCSWWYFVSAVSGYSATGQARAALGSMGAIAGFVTGMLGYMYH